MENCKAVYFQDFLDVVNTGEIFHSHIKTISSLSSREKRLSRTLSDSLWRSLTRHKLLPAGIYPKHHLPCIPTLSSLDVLQLEKMKMNSSCDQRKIASPKYRTYFISSTKKTLSTSIKKLPPSLARMWLVIKGYFSNHKMH